MYRHKLLALAWIACLVACGSSPPTEAPFDAATDASEDAGTRDGGGSSPEGGRDGAPGDASGTSEDASAGDDAGDADGGSSQEGGASHMDAATGQEGGASDMDAAAEAGATDASQDAEMESDALPDGPPADGADGGAGCAGDATAIATAIADAATGDTVRICAGSYVVNLFVGKDLTLLGDGPETTRLTSATNQAILLVDEDVAATVEGLTLHDSAGGAIVANSAGPLALRDCVLENNSASYGAGVYGPSEALLTLENVRFSGNSVSGQGGAVHAHQVEATNVHVLNNTASIQGGGMLLAGVDPRLTMNDSLFEGNEAGALLTGQATLMDTVFRDNVSGTRATAVLQNGVLTRVTFEGNSTTQTGSALRMVAVAEGEETPSVSLVDSVITGNTAGYGGAVYISGQSAEGDVLATFSSMNTDWGSEETDDDNNPRDVMVHDIGEDNSAYSFGADASFTCTFSPRQCAP